MPGPTSPPIGLHLSRVARTVARAFDAALGEVGGSTPVWLILISLKTHRLGTQQELADAIGIRGATLTHHLNSMEGDGLVRRRRDPGNRRVQQVELTDVGEKAFRRMRGAAATFDQRLRQGLTEAETAALAGLLDRLAANIVGD